MRKLMITFLLALGCSSAMATHLYSWEPATNDVSPAVDEAAAKAELEAYCASQRNRLTTMENNPRLSRTLPDGTVERIGEDERQAMIAETRSDLQKYCQD